MDTTLYQPIVINHIKDFFELFIRQITQTRTQYSWRFTKIIASKTILVRKEKEIKAYCMVRQARKEETQIISLTEEGIIAVKAEIKGCHSYRYCEISHTRV